MKPDLTPYNNIVNIWAEGYHISSSGKTIALSDMPPTYLNNVINKFSSMGYDTSALEGYLAAEESGNPPPDTFAPIAQANQ